MSEPTPEAKPALLREIFTQANIAVGLAVFAVVLAAAPYVVPPVRTWMVREAMLSRPDMLQDASDKLRAQMQAKADQARDAARINLIRVYFGQLAAQSLENSARQSRDALAKLYDDSQKFEAEGVTPRARTLEAEVARDTAERAYQRAVLAH